jgi:hypothetical protein
MTIPARLARRYVTISNINIKKSWPYFDSSGGNSTIT